MAPRTWILAVLGALGLLVALSWASTRPDPPPPLSVHLRCRGAPSGQLVAGLLSEAGETLYEQVFSLAEVCAVGSITLDRDLGPARGPAPDEQDAWFEVRTPNGRGRFVARYGADVHRDEQAYYLVLAVSEEPPFVRGDRI